MVVEEQGKIDREQFFVMMKFKHSTHQISFHIFKALECLEFIRSEVV